MVKEMATLIGLYSVPEAEMVELDDEARRAISKAIGEGASVVGVFDRDDENLWQLIAKVSREAWIASGGDCDAE